MAMKAIACAAYLVERAIHKENPISNLQLQKMLFFAQVDHMTKNDGARLFSDDIYAWQYGPVIPYVYNAYSRYGGSPIRQAHLPEQADILDSNNLQTGTTPDVLSMQESLENVYDIWAGRPAWDLVAESHKQGKAWDLVYNRGGVMRSGYGDVISDQLIMDTYGK